MLSKCKKLFDYNINCLYKIISLSRTPTIKCVCAQEHRNSYAKLSNIEHVTEFAITIGYGKTIFGLFNQQDMYYRKIICNAYR